MNHFLLNQTTSCLVSNFCFKISKSIFICPNEFVLAITEKYQVSPNKGFSFMCLRHSTLSFYEFSFFWYYIVFIIHISLYILLCLIYFTSHSALKVHPCGHKSSISFYFVAVWYSTLYMSHFLYPFICVDNIVNTQLRLSPYLGYYK